MAQQTINIGASPNDGTGTPLRTSFDYTNQNFTELYTALGGGVGLPGATTQVIFNDGGTNLAGDAGLVYNKTTDALTVAGLVTAGSATITGAATVTGAANLNGAVNLSTSGTPTVTLGASSSYGLLVGSGANAASIYINGATAANASKLLYGASQHEWYNSTLSSLIATLNTTGLNVAGSIAINGASSTYPFNARASSSNVGNTAFIFEQLNGTPILTGRDNGTIIIAGDIRVGNTVNTVSPTSPNRTITMIVNGVTLYIAAKTTND